METSDFIAIGSLIATIVIGITSWFVSAHVTKMGLSKKKLNYELKMFPIISKKFLNVSNELEIKFQNNLLSEPTLLAVDILNAGNVAIANPPITIESVGATYLIPGYIEDVPPGYDNLWRLERTEDDTCKIIVEHINPGQIIKARFFLDELPSKVPMFKCPMKDLEIREIDTEINQVFFDTMVGGFRLTGLDRSFYELFKLISKKF